MAPKVPSAKASGSGSVPKESSVTSPSPASPSTSKSSPSKRKEKTASLSKDQIRKCLLRYVDNILCLDDIQGVVSLHQLGLLPREEVNSVFDEEEGRAEKATVRAGGSRAVKKHAEGKGGGGGGGGGGGENMWEKKEWEFLEGVMRGDVTMNDFQLHPGATSANSMLSSLVPNGYNPYNGSKSYMARPQLHGPVPSLSPVDINARNSEGETALTFALKNEQLDMIKVLVEKGKADINSQNADGNTELMLAARRGQTRMVKLLVETMGANVHLRNKEGLTALMVAEKYERTEIVRFLRGFVVAGGRVKGRGTGVKGRGTR